MVLSKEKLYGIIGAVALVFITGALFMFYSGESPGTQQQDKTPYGIIAEDADVILMADVGTDIEWLVSEEDGRRQIFERYRLIRKAAFEQFTGTEGQVNSVDITKANAKVFLTGPSGTREEITSDVPYIRFAILPSADAGKYVLEIKINSGEEYNFEFEFKEPKKAELVATGKTRIEENTQTEEKLLGHPENEQGNHELTAFSLDVLDLNKATSVFHITPGNAAYGGSLIEVRKLAGINKYFWIDTELLRENYNIVQESITELQKIDRNKLGPTELDHLERYERPTAFEHIFLAKVDGIWYYAIANYPEDF